jgi:FkbM family methyltransferase
MKKAIWNTLNTAVGWFGYELRARSREAPTATMYAALRRLQQRRLAVGTVIDVGAASGRWARKAAEAFPSSQFLMVEPLEERRGALQKLRTEDPRMDFVIAAAGDKRGSATLTVSPDLDGSGIYGGMAKGLEERVVAVTTIDDEVCQRSLPGPYLLKLDTHGFELPIIAGADHTLRNAAAVIVEVYNFQLSPGCLRFHEMCAHFERLGLRCADLVDPMLRPLDGVLWQFDLIFLPANSACFAEARYQ